MHFPVFTCVFLTWVVRKLFGRRRPQWRLATLVACWQGTPSTTSPCGAPRSSRQINVTVRRSPLFRAPGGFKTLLRDTTQQSGGRGPGWSRHFGVTVSFKERGDLTCVLRSHRTLCTAPWLALLASMFAGAADGPYFGHCCACPLRPTRGRVVRSFRAARSLS